MAATPLTAEAAIQKQQMQNKKQKGRAPAIAAGLLLLTAANVGIWLYRTSPDNARFGRTAFSRSSESESSIESIPLAPFVVNLAGGGGYLKATLTLIVRKDDLAAESKFERGAADPANSPANSALTRDTILSTLSTQDPSVLLTVEGKNALKKELKANLKAKAPDLLLDDIYFTEFLIER
jgi:flagellar protein FliL